MGWPYSADFSRNRSHKVTMVASEYTTPEGLLGELMITALVRSLMSALKASKSIWKSGSRAGTTLRLAPLHSTKTWYSVK